MVHMLGSGVLRSGLLALALLSQAPALAAESAAVSSPRVTATLLSSRDAVAPGERFQVALVQKIAPGWHTYWRNPGDSGEATRIDWVLPAGMSAGEIQWPAPKALPVEPLLNFGFEGEVLLPVEITVPETARPGERLTLQANATWLVCEKICIPEEGAFTLELPVGPASAVDEAAQARIDAARAALPKPASFRGRLVADGEKLALSLPGLSGAVADLRFFPVSDTLIEHAAPQAATSAGDGATLQLIRSSAFKIENAELDGVITFSEGGVARALTLAADVDPALVTASADGAAAPRSGVLRASVPVQGADLSFWAALAFAFAGGLILNLMPCVLPVLFIKALGFVQVARASRAEVREQGLLFLCGVLATFLVLAGIVIVFAALGSSVGWGYQLQSPPVVIALAVVMTLIGFNLLGAFEVGASAGGIGQGLAGRGGRIGAFMTGALAVVVATPCTAPFMGAAMGYAVTQPPAVALFVFMALALGFALPVVALSFAPGLLALLPKPGRWMVILKQAFAFPMFATAIWLIWVASVQSGPAGVLVALVAVLAAGFVVWLLGVARGTRAQLATSAIAVLVALGTGWFVLQGAVPSATGQARAGDMEAWTPERVAALQAQGRPVFVNFTAAWCITCLANERVALSRQEVKDAFAALGVAYLKADWTNRDATIARALAEQGRAGVPLYLFYPASKGGQAEILPQLLSADMIVAAAERAAGKTARTAANRP